jgi:hypothetical protein
MASGNIRGKSILGRLRHGLVVGTRPRILLCILSCFLALTACKSGRAIDRAAAKKVSDAFMSNLALDRVSEAVSEMELAPRQSVGSEQFETQIRKLFDYCGRPLDSEFKHDEIGFRVYAMGRQKPMRKFYYSANTTQYQKGVCFFAVEVVPDGSDLRVANFGPLKLLSGQLPEYLR